MNVWEIYKDIAGYWRWRAKDFKNGNVLAISSESYNNRVDCVACAKRFGYIGE